jgi:hypothetical protein
LIGRPRVVFALGGREIIAEPSSPWSASLRLKLRVGCSKCGQPIKTTYSCCGVKYRGAEDVPTRVLPTDNGSVAFEVEDLEELKNSLPAGVPIDLERIVPVADLAASYILSSPVLLVPGPDTDLGLYLGMARTLLARGEAALGRGVIGRMPRRIAVLGFPGRILAAYTLMDLRSGDPAYDLEAAEPDIGPILSGLRSGDLAYPADEDPVEVFLQARVRVAQETTNP